MTGHPKTENKKQETLASRAVISSSSNTGRSKNIAKQVEKCAICRSGIENRATLETCFHDYCFQCIVSWSKDPKHRASCPRCDKPYQNILYNIRHDNTFDVYQVPESECALEQRKVDERDHRDFCSICLGDYVDRSSVENCLHTFCFSCITSWAETKLKCPLCNGKFETIYHNVKENLIYDEYKVKKTKQNQTEQDQFNLTDGYEYIEDSIEYVYDYDEDDDDHDDNGCYQNRAQTNLIFSDDYNRSDEDDEDEFKSDEGAYDDEDESSESEYSSDASDSDDEQEFITLRTPNTSSAYERAQETSRRIRDLMSLRFGRSTLQDEDEEEVEIPRRGTKRKSDEHDGRSRKRRSQEL